MEFVVACVTDLHFGPKAYYQGKLRKLSHRAQSLADAFVDELNRSVRPNLVVNLGDDIEDEDHDSDLHRYTTCIETLGKSHAELVNVAGNHDTVNLSPVELLRIWRRKGDAKLFYSFDRGGKHFVVLHTRERKDRDVSIGHAQLAWLESDLAATRRPTVVLMHHSAADQDLRGNPWFEKKAHICLVNERKALRRVLHQSGKVILVLNGHLHWNHLDVIDGIPFVTVQSLVENLDDDAPGRAARAHAIVRLTTRRIVVEVGGAERARYQFNMR